jgi:hypothetical protein
MVRMFRHLLTERSIQVGRVAGVAALWAIALAVAAPAVHGQPPGPGVHYYFNASAPPGAIGGWQLLRGGPVAGYFQPVEIKAPAGTVVSLAVEGRFEPSQQVPRKVGLLIGSVYRFSVANIPLNPGLEVFPTIEMIDRIYPPLGQQWRFAIPIELTQEDLQLALSGRFVTRVIYLEDPQNPTPAKQIDDTQTWFDVGPGRDPLAVADSLGRPVAILRMGGRLPEPEEATSPSFLYGCPSWLDYHQPAIVRPETVPAPTQSQPEPSPPAAEPKKP